MEELFLTCEKNTKKTYKKLIKQTASAIADAFVNESAYSGPTPDELKKIVAQDSILPEHGLGWDKVFALTKEKVGTEWGLLMLGYDFKQLIRLMNA